MDDPASQDTLVVGDGPNSLSLPVMDGLPIRVTDEGGGYLTGVADRGAKEPADASRGSQEYADSFTPSCCFAFESQVKQSTLPRNSWFCHGVAPPMCGQTRPREVHTMMVADRLDGSIVGYTLVFLGGQRPLLTARSVTISPFRVVVAESGF